MTVQLQARLRQLELGGMAAALDTQQQQPGTYQELPFIERLALLLDQEQLQREQRKQERLVRLLILDLCAAIHYVKKTGPRAD